MLSYVDLQSEEFLSKAIKKAYVEQLGSEIKEMIQTIEAQRAMIQQLEDHQKELEHEVEVRDAQLKIPEHKVALAIKEMMRAEAVNTVESRTPSIVRKQVSKHLDVRVDTEGYYEEYSGQSEHYHESTATVEWH